MGFFFHRQPAGGLRRPAALPERVPVGAQHVTEPRPRHHLLGAHQGPAAPAAARPQHGPLQPHVGLQRPRLVVAVALHLRRPDQVLLVDQQQKQNKTKTPSKTRLDRATCGTDLCWTHVCWFYVVFYWVVSRFTEFHLVST